MSKLVTRNNPDDFCTLCMVSEKDTVSFGEFFSRRDVMCHHFCLLSATNLPKKGSAADGIMGFLVSDIKECYQTNKVQQCEYCKNNSASIECAHKGCTSRFHYICGTRNNCVTEMDGNFQSHCHLHHNLPKEKIPHETTDECRICLCSMGTYNPTTSFLPSCCKDIERWWFHKNCLMRATAEAGIFTNCPFCADKDNYIPQIKKFGIFVPERNASWDCSKDDFAEMKKLKSKNTNFSSCTQDA